MPTVKQCKSFDDFIDLMDDAKCCVNDIFINGKKQSKRKSNFDDIEDIFDSNVPVTYTYGNDTLNVFIGDYKPTVKLISYIGSKLVLKELPELKFGLPNVTVGNEYLIVDVEGSNFWLIDDDGQKTSFNYTRFVI